ncbi:MFS transporter [Nocardiopsis changdeensis]|uniref:MFS transporter n=1 Tax=Nocardiopsis changdeensis TaxID=2831969 RepID=UPI003F46A2AD
MNTGTNPAGAALRAARDGGLRRMYAAQAVGAVVDGAVLATAVLYFGTRVGVPVPWIGLVLGAGNLAALAAAVPLGALADAVGARRAAVGFTCLVGASLAVYAVADGPWTYAVGAVVFVVAQTGLGAARQAVVAARVEPRARVAARGRMHTLLNAGMGAGTVLGALVLAAGADAGFTLLYGGGALVVLGCALLLAGMPADPADSAAAGRDRRISAALGDRRLLAVTALTSVVQLCLPVLSVILPLWAAQGTRAPGWVPAVALGLNTVLVLAVQRPWADRVVSDAAAARSALWAAAALPGGCVLLGAAGTGGAAAATALVLAGIVLITVGEVAGGPPAWHLALRDVPAALQARHQAVFGMAGSVARIAGSAALLPFVLAAGAWGWAAVGAAMAAAAPGLALLARPVRRARPHGRPGPGDAAADQPTEL